METASAQSKEMPVSKVARREARVVTDPFRAAMQKINTLLADYPDVLTIRKVKRVIPNDESEQTIDAYSWIKKDKESVEARAEMKTDLVIAWQSGALNYDMIAAALRIEPMSIRALLDEEFIENNGL
jgi:hypothetical protein